MLSIFNPFGEMDITNNLLGESLTSFNDYCKNIKKRLKQYDINDESIIIDLSQWNKNTQEFVFYEPLCDICEVFVGQVSPLHIESVL